MKQRTRINIETWRSAAYFVFEGRRLVCVDGSVPGDGPPSSDTGFLVVCYEECSARYFRDLLRRAEELGWGRVRPKPGGLDIDLLGARRERELAREAEGHE